MKKNKYVIGNWLRGYFEGQFDNQQQAWEHLGKRFLLSYPTESGRGRDVTLWVKETNQYDITDLVPCQEGECHYGDIDISDKSILSKTKVVPMLGMMRG